MKRSLLLILLCFALTSCAVQYQQIASITSPQVSFSHSGQYCYSDDDVVVNYNFWAKHGKVSFVITNNLDTDIYVDLSRSFFVVNGITFDYFQNRTYSNHTASTEATSVSYGASNTLAVASGIAAAITSYYGSYAAGVSGGASSTNSYGKQASKAVTVNKGIEYKEKEGVWIPAHASRSFNEFTLLKTPYRECGLARNPTSKEDMTMTFDEYTTPYAFDNVLTLVIDGVDKRVVNSFHINKMTNVLDKDAYVTEKESDCNGKKEVRYYKFYSPNKFYIPYLFESATDGADRIKGKTIRSNQSLITPRIGSNK